MPFALPRRLVAALAAAAVVLPAATGHGCPLPAPEGAPPPPMSPTPAPNAAPATAPMSPVARRFVARALREAIVRSIARGPMGGERTSGKVVVSDAFADELAAFAGFTRTGRGPQGGRTWIDARSPTAAPRIVLYRIRWFNGGWSKWYLPGVNDRDGKDPTGRVWRYFTDHEHEMITIDAGAAMPTRDELIGFDA